jgi:hypothetical protein
MASAMGSPDRGWGSAARTWGLIAGVAFVAATLVYLVEAVGLLGSPAAYVSTAAGQLQDEAVFWAGVFAYRHTTLWDYALRDGLFFIAYLGLIPLVLAANATTGGGRAVVQIGGAFLAIGAFFGALNAVVYFADISYWRGTGWEQTPATIMAAVGRDTDAIDGISSWCGTASYAALALGLGYLGRACRVEAALPRRLGVVAYVGAATLVGLFALSVARIDGTDTLTELLSLVIGVIVAPIFTIGLGLHLGRVVAREPAEPASVT